MRKIYKRGSVRNYIKVFGGVVIVQNAMLQNSYYSAFGTDEAECQAQIDFWSSFVPAGGMLVSASAPVGAWFSMDKRNLIDFMSFVANAGLPNAGTSLFGGSIGGPGSIFVADDGTNETPRRGWTDDSGVKRTPPPSDKTASTKTGGKGGTLNISLLEYLLLLLNTWSGGERLKSGQFLVQPAPQRWIEWLTLLISHYNRYTPTQIYGFLARVDFTAATFPV